MTHAVCNQCGQPCSVILVEDTEEFPDRDANGRYSHTQEIWVSECCEWDYSFDEDTNE